MLRRSFVLSAAVSAGGWRPNSNWAPARVAAIINAYFPNSHADVFMGRLLGCYRLNGTTYHPKVDVVSMYLDQFPANDSGRMHRN